MQLNDFLKAGGPKIRKALEQHLGISKSYLAAVKSFQGSNTATNAGAW